MTLTSQPVRVRKGEKRTHVSGGSRPGEDDERGEHGGVWLIKLLAEIGWFIIRVGKDGCKCASDMRGQGAISPIAPGLDGNARAGWPCRNSKMVFRVLVGGWCCIL